MTAENVKGFPWVLEVVWSGGVRDLLGFHTNGEAEARVLHILRNASDARLEAMAIREVATSSYRALRLEIVGGSVAYEVERADSRGKLADLFGVPIEGDAGAPDVQYTILARMLASLEKHDQVQERTAKAFETIAEHLGNLRVAIDLSSRRRARKSPRRRRVST